MVIRVKNHRVQSGETFESIAPLYGTTAKRLEEINGFRTPDLSKRTLVMVPSGKEESDD